MKAKAVCVMRTDLRNSDGNKVPKGKLIAQGGHAFVGLVNKLMRPELPAIEKRVFWVERDSALDKWINGSFVKIVLAVDSEEELLELSNRARAAGLNTVDIIDNGLTEFHEATFTCIGIGPDWEDKIDKITGHLKGFQ